jgi:serine/threonine protein kinase
MATSQVCVSLSSSRKLVVTRLQSNVLVDVKDGEYKACLTDFGLSTVPGESSDDTTNEDSKIRHGAIRWTAPELLILDDHPADLKPTTKHDMYSFGRVMFHASANTLGPQN